MNDKSIDGVLGTWIRGGRIVGADEYPLSYGGTPVLFAFYFVGRIRLRDFRKGLKLLVLGDFWILNDIINFVTG